MVTVAKKNISSIAPSGNLTAIYATPFAELDLPDKVIVTYDDNSTEELLVLWNESEYDSRHLGEQHLTGSVQLFGDVTNTSGLKGTISITLIKNILSADSIADRKVVYGTPFSVLALPETIKVIYNDLSEANLPVIWDSSVYDAADAGQLVLNAVLPQIPGTANTDSLRAAVLIQIDPAELIITAEHIMRTRGEPNPELTFTYAGFVKGENESALTMKPSLSTPAVESSEPGEYPIVIEEAAAPNYNIVFVDGILHVIAEQIRPLQASGPLSVFQIADQMLLLGEISQEERDVPFSIAFLNSKSHLSNKNAPYRVSDWYGYGPAKTTARLVTSGIRNISAGAAGSGGYIHSDGGAAIIERGVCWSTSPNPTIAANKTNDGRGSGSFSSAITGLVPGTIYYVRAYAVNSEGTVYGNEVVFRAE